MDTSEHLLPLVPPTNNIPPPSIYAIRRGRGVSNGIFLSYDDCRHFIENSDSEYSIFHHMEDAFAYLNAYSPGGHNHNSPAPTHHHVNAFSSKADEEDDGHRDPIEPPQNDHTVVNSTTFPNIARLTKVSSSGKKSAPFSVMTSFSKHSKSRIKAVNNPKRRPTKAWEKMFEQFKSHVEEKGTARVESTDDPALHKWTKQQEIEYKNMLNGKGSSMFQAKIDKLQEAGFKFSYVSIQDQYANLYKFKEDNGHFNVPPSNPLYKWVEKHRLAAKNFARGDSSSYFDMRLKELTALGFQASMTVPPEGMDDDDQVAWEHDHNWDAYFNQLLAFKEKHNHCDVAKDDDCKLHAWVKRQHQEYQKIAEGKPNCLTLERIQKLTDIGFVFEKKKLSVKWDERMKQLKRFKAKHGHVRVPKSDPELGVFVNRQRYEYTKKMAGKPSTLNEKRLNDLKALDFIFSAGRTPKNTPKKSWEERYQELVEYKGENSLSLCHGCHHTSNNSLKQKLTSKSPTIYLPKKNLGLSWFLNKRLGWANGFIASEHTTKN